MSGIGKQCPLPMGEVVEFEIDNPKLETALVPYRGAQLAQPSPLTPLSTIPSPTSPAPDDVDNEQQNQQHIPIPGIGIRTFQTTCAVKGCDSKFIRQPTRPGKQKSSSLQTNIVNCQIVFPFISFIKLSVFCLLSDPRQIQFCGRHWSARASLYQQASKKDKDLAASLQVMEKNNPDEFADHVGNFVETFPDKT